MGKIHARGFANIAYGAASGAKWESLDVLYHELARMARHYSSAPKVFFKSQQLIDAIVDKMIEN